MPEIGEWVVARKLGLCKLTEKNQVHILNIALFCGVVIYRIERRHYLLGRWMLLSTFKVKK